MTIGIFGDSFAVVDNHKNRSWTGLLAEILDEGYVCYGEPSTSIWWSYELFLKHYKKYDKIVFTYSHYSRWSYLPEHLTKLSLIRPKGHVGGFDSHGDDSLKKYVDILLEAHPILYSEELQLFTYQNIFNSVNKLCKDTNIKLINLMPFEQSYVDFPTNNKLVDLYIDISEAFGPCLTGLADVSFGELLDQRGLVHKDSFKGKVFDKRASHLSLDNNKVLASIISEIFNSEQTRPKLIQLQKDNRFFKGTFFNEN